MPPHIYVISLATAHERRVFMRQQLDALALPYTIVDGVHGATTPDHALFRKYNDKKRLCRRGAGSSLRLSQLGCFASHYLLWQRCLESKQAIIVLEDDAILQPIFTDFHQAAEQLATRYDLIWLQPSRKQDQHAGRKMENCGPFMIRQYTKGFSGATGYLLTPTAAKTLLAYSTEWLYPVDNTMDRFFEHGIAATGLDPACIQQDDDFESSINVADAGARRTVPDRLRREAYSLKDTLARTWYNLKAGMGARNP
ncbi:glycosyltransferase family 25 protein [Castellaniella sp.]|uniref:glycosyltransferase family 25 protein n=1 Tax=Castellaniella sp. TaxID=1955812 RepID=UPI003A90A334